MPGKEIASFVESQNIPWSTVITDIQQERHHLELFDHTAAEKDAIITDLGSHKRLEETLKFSTKTLPLQKTILFGVPVCQWVLHFITSCIHWTAFMNLTEMMLRSWRPYRSPGCKNWFLLLPLPLATAIINDGGIPLGLKICRLRPFTEVQRCRNWQAYGHVAKYCTFCDNCGEKHHL